MKREECIRTMCIKTRPSYDFRQPSYLINRVTSRLLLLSLIELLIVRKNEKRCFRSYLPLPESSTQHVQCWIPEHNLIVKTQNIFPALYAGVNHPIPRHFKFTEFQKVSRASYKYIIRMKSIRFWSESPTSYVLRL